MLKAHDAVLSAREATLEIGGRKILDRISMDVRPGEIVTGCPFAPRCNRALERCWKENPVLEPVAPGHRVACWVDMKTGKYR